MNADQMRTIDRIKKLLRLGGSNHPAEAEAALAKARELADAAGVAISGIDAGTIGARVTHERGGPRRRTFERSMAHGVLSDHFGVKILFSGSLGCIYIGPEVNIAIARHVESFMLREHAAALALFKSKNGKRATAARCRSFKLGWFCAVWRKLEQRPLRNDQAAVAERQDAAARIDSYIADKFKVRETAAKPRRRVDRAAQSIGFAFGDTLNLSRPVEAVAGSKCLEGGAA